VNAIHARALRTVALIGLSLSSFALQEPPAPKPEPSKPEQGKPDASKPAAGAAAAPKTEEDPKAASTFSIAQLEQIAAPIALYPDALLAHVMMAATYPLEIVQAFRWQQKNASLKGDALESALKANEWDPAVKSLCGFPEVLKKMNDNLDWTQDLGDAFLGQKKELMDTIQTMRGKAIEAGQLKSTEQQTVTQGEDKIIVVQSTNPEVVYVPTYSPTVVYGSAWSYPAYYYPPMYAYPPPGYGFVSFGFGVAVGAAIWGDCNWGGSDVDIDIDNHNNFVNRSDGDPKRNQMDKRSGNKSKFNHDPAHRGGVNYKSPKTAQQYGAKSGTNRVSKDQARGFDRGTGTSSNRASSTGTNRVGNSSTRPGTSSPQRGSTTRPSAGSSGTSRSSGSGSSSRASPSRSSSGGGALSGSRSPSLDRAGSARGASSRGGGGGRGGGGRRR